MLIQSYFLINQSIRYQTHQLRHVSENFCATVSCYRYDENDHIQWNVFDYVNDENGEVGNFFPNTDFTFGEMRRIVLKEMQNGMENTHWGLPPTGQSKEVPPDSDMLKKNQKIIL